jgi:hypothetical protein
MLEQSLNAITIASTLLLAPLEPREVRVSGSQVWISEPGLIEAQPLEGNKALLVAKEFYGESYIYGLAAKNVRRLVVTSKANLTALERCTKHKLLFHVNTSDGSLVLNELSPKGLRIVQECGFDRISAPDPASLSDQVKSLQEALNREQISLSQVQFEDKRLSWSIPKNKVEKLKKILGPLSAFSDFRTEEVQSHQTIVFKIDLFEFSQSSASGHEIRGVHQNSSGLRTALLNSQEQLSYVYARAQSSGKLLASPQLRTVPGKTAEFNSGGEIPVQDAQVIGAKTTWKPYGLKILITPSENASSLNSEITTTIQIEYSQPDYGNSTQGVPALITRNLKNEFNLAMSQTTLLTSMVQVRRGNNSRSFLGLGAIPLIGELFHSSANNRDQSEVWFLITPSWAIPITPGEVTRTWNRYATSK